MNKFYLNYLLILFVSFLTIIGCSTDDEIIEVTQKIEENQKFYIFSNPSNIQNKGVQINDYAKGFAITMQKYDSVQKTNITGLVNTQNTFSNNAKLRQNFINEAIEPYVETRIHSENIIDEYGNISVFYPKIFNNKVQDIFIAQISESETLIKYYILNKDSNIYNNTVKLFQEKYDFIFLNKISKLLNKTNSGFDECGFEGLPSCDLGTVIITPGGGSGGNGTIFWTPGGGAIDIGGGGCKPHEMCLAPPSDGGGGSNIHNYSEEDRDPSCKSFDFKNVGTSNFQEAGVKNISQLFSARTPNNRYAIVSIIVAELYFGLPINRANGEYYSAGRAAEISANALGNAFDKVSIYFNNNPFASNINLENYFINSLRNEMNRYGGTISKTPSIGSNYRPNIKDYQSYWFFEDSCDN